MVLGRFSSFVSFLRWVGVLDRSCSLGAGVGSWQWWINWIDKKLDGPMDERLRDDKEESIALRRLASGLRGEIVFISQLRFRKKNKTFLRRPPVITSQRAGGSSREIFILFYRFFMFGELKDPR